MISNVTYVDIYGHITTNAKYPLWLKHTSDATTQH